MFTLTSHKYIEWLIPVSILVLGATIFAFPLYAQEAGPAGPAGGIGESLGAEFPQEPKSEAGGVSATAQPTPQSAETRLQEIKSAYQYQSVGDYLFRLYIFLVALVGLATLGAFVYGGILYISSAGNPGMESIAKKYITNAVVGFLLAAGSWVILNTINPDLVRRFELTIPGLKQPAAVQQTAEENAKRQKELEQASFEKLVTP